jgi:hypothetical protein
MEVTYYEKAMSDLADCRRMVDSIIADRDRLITEKDRLQRTIDRIEDMACRIITGLAPNHEGTKLAMLIRDEARAALTTPQS